MLFRKSAVIMKTGAFVLLASSLPTALSAQAIADAKSVKATNVKIINTPNVNVANTPTVAVGNTPTVNVGNTPSVNVVNSPEVSVSNAATKPVFVVNLDDPGRIPYQSSLTILGTPNCSGTFCFLDFGQVPVGHRVVIQRISGTADFDATTPATPITALVLLENGRPGAIARFAATPAPSGGFSAFNETLQAYFNQNDLIKVEVILFGANFPTLPDRGVSVTLSGYELDCNLAPCAPIAH